MTGILDPRLSFVYVQSAQLDWSAHLSLTTMGVELRVLPVGSQGSAPLVLALGAHPTAYSSSGPGKRAKDD